MEVIFAKIRNNAQIPVRQHVNDAGYDLTWAPEVDDYEQNAWFKGTLYPEIRIVKPGESVLLKTGLKAMFAPGYVMRIDNRSGMAAKRGFHVGACVVDASYRGEIFVNLLNVSSENQYIIPGERVAQFLIFKVETIVASEISEDEYNKYETSRGNGSLGSTGNK